MLSHPTAARTPLHIRTINYQGFARAYGFWVIEDELRDNKHCHHTHGDGERAAGEAVHHLETQRQAPPPPPDNAAND